MDVSHLSPSGLNLLQMCGLAYRYKYIDKRPTCAGTAAAVGTAVHKSAEHDLGCMRDEGVTMPDEQVSDLVSDAFEDAWESREILFQPDEKADLKGTKAGCKDQSINLAHLHHQELAPTLKPVLIEHKLEVEFEGFPLKLLGYADVIEVGNVLRDLKTRARTPNANDAANDIGLAFYAMALDATSPGVKPVPKMALDVLTKTKTPQRHTVFAAPEPGHGPILRRIELAAKVIAAGAYLPAPPGHWKCSEKFCEFWADCPFGKPDRRVITP